MNYYKIQYEDGRFIIAKAKDSLDIIKKYDLATAENIETRVIQLESNKKNIKEWKSWKTIKGL